MSNQKQIVEAKALLQGEGFVVLNNIEKELIEKKLDFIGKTADRQLCGIMHNFALQLNIINGNLMDLMVSKNLSKTEKSTLTGARNSLFEMSELLSVFTP